MAIATKDLRSEWRTKEALNASGAFAIVILLLFSFAFDPGSESTREFGGGLLWLVFMFAGALIVNRTFARELPNDCLEVLISSPVPGAAIFLGKVWASAARRAGRFALACTAPLEWTRRASLGRICRLRTNSEPESRTTC